MSSFQFAAVIERERNLFVAHCLELDIASTGGSGDEALMNLKDTVASFVAHAEEAEILERLARDVEVRPFDVGRG